jgi:hypothetical protein
VIIRNTYVTFMTPDPIKLPVPSPTYRHIHAACAKVAHLSGVATCIDKLYRDLEDGQILTYNTVVRYSSVLNSIFNRFAFH